jgi:SAM-dependent methyltransferase
MIGTAAFPSGARLIRAFRRRRPGDFLKLCLLNLRVVLSGEAKRHAYVHDDSWDRLYGVSTAGTLETDEFGAPPEELVGAVRYEPTPPDCFEWLVEAAELEPGVDYTFIDVGSGKGRVLLLAALHGFKRVIGIELGVELHDAACRNIARMRGRLGSAKVTSIRADATRFDFPPEPTLCFLNNPFDAAVLDRLLDRIEASRAATPRPFTLIYYHSNHADRIAARPGWEMVRSGFWTDESHHFTIHRAGAAG